jgi:WD40 repeat protein
LFNLLCELLSSWNPNALFYFCVCPPNTTPSLQAEAQFSHDVGGDPMILTAANDKSLVLSRLKVSGGGGGGGGGEIALSATLSRAAGLYDHHAGGIFAMEAQHGEILCCSKDATVTLTAIRECSLELVRSYDEIAGSILKSVRWQPGPANGIFACGGNDGNVVVIDRRGAKPTVTIEAHEAGYCNSVQFSSTNPHELISSAFDRTIRVWDLRNTAKPTFTLEGEWELCLT